MRIGTLVCLLLLAPGDTHQLKYRFTKGMSYTDVQKRVWSLTITADGRVMKWRVNTFITLKRTILEVDETAHPTIERVQVIRFRNVTAESPQVNEVGTQPRPSEGKTFVWRRLDSRWGLYDGTAEVTGRFGELVEQLKNWRDSRLPPGPQRVGASWQVSSERFLETAGLQVPKGVKGAAIFKLEKVEEGIATIPFDIRYSFRIRDKPLEAKQKGVWRRLEVKQKGVWKFDVARGRDLAFSMKGTVMIEEGKAGEGRLTMSRKVTYSR